MEERGTILVHWLKDHTEQYFKVGKENHRFPLDRELSLATGCWLLGVQQKTPALPPALVVSSVAVAGGKLGLAERWEREQRERERLLLAAVAVAVSPPLLQNSKTHIPRLCVPPYFCTSSTASLYLLPARLSWFSSPEAPHQNYSAHMSNWKKKKSW